MTELPKRPLTSQTLREKILAMTPTESCGHLARTFDGGCMTCARETERNEGLALAWDAAIHHVQPHLDPAVKRAAMRDNPYRMSS